MTQQELGIATTQREFYLNEFFRPFERIPVKIGQQDISCYEAQFGIETGELVPYATIPLVARVGKRPDLLKSYPDSDNQPILTIEDDRSEPFFYRNFCVIHLMLSKQTLRQKLSRYLRGCMSESLFLETLRIGLDRVKRL